MSRTTTTLAAARGDRQGTVRAGKGRNQPAHRRRDVKPGPPYRGRRGGKVGTQHATHKGNPAGPDFQLAPTALILPSCESIPAVLYGPSSAGGVPLFAQALVAAGVLQECHFKKDLETAITAALGQWVEARLQGHKFKYFPSMHLRWGIAFDGVEKNFIGSTKSPVSGLYIMSGNQRYMINCGFRITEMDALLPRAGQITWAAFQCRLSRFINAYMPVDSFLQKAVSD